MTCLILGASPCSFVTGSVVCIKGRLKARKHAGRNFHQQPYHHKAPSNSGQEHAAIQQADGWQSSVQTTLSAHHIWEYKLGRCGQRQRVVPSLTYTHTSRPPSRPHPAHILRPHLYHPSLSHTHTLYLPHIYLHISHSSLPHLIPRLRLRGFRSHRSGHDIVLPPLWRPAKVKQMSDT